MPLHHSGGIHRTSVHHHHHHHGPRGPRQPLSTRTTAICFGAVFLFLAGVGLITAGGILLGKAIDDTSYNSYVPSTITTMLETWESEILRYQASSSLIPGLLELKTAGSVDGATYAGSGSLTPFTSQATAVAPTSGNVMPSPLPVSYALVAENVSIGAGSAFASNAERFVVTLVTTTTSTGTTRSDTITLPYVQKEQTQTKYVVCRCPGVTGCTCSDTELAATECTDLYTNAVYYSYGLSSCGNNVRCGYCTYSLFIGDTVCHTLKLEGDGTVGNPFGWSAGYYNSCEYPFNLQPLPSSTAPAGDMVTLKLISDIDPNITLGVITKGKMTIGTVYVGGGQPRGAYYAMIAIGAVALVGAIACLCLFYRWVKEQGVTIAVDGTAAGGGDAAGGAGDPTKDTDAGRMMMNQNQYAGTGSGEATMMVMMQPAPTGALSMGYHRPPPSAHPDPQQHQWGTPSMPGFGLPTAAPSGANMAPNHHGFS